MGLKSGQQWSGLVVTKKADDTLSAASVGPVGVLYVNGVANGASVTVSGANPYKWTVTLPSLTAGDLVSMYLTATIDGIATAEVVAEDVADTKRVSDLTDEVIGTGAGLTAIGDARMANLDAAVNSRAVAGDAMTLTADYDAAKTAAQAGDAMTLTADYDAAKTAAQAGDAMTLTADYDAAKTAAQAGDAMTLTAAYDAAKTAAQAGDAMALTAGERTTLTAAIVAALTAATAYLAAIAAAVWAYATRTLTQSAASVTSTVSGTTITATRGDTLSASLAGLGNISTRSKLWFAVKVDPDNQTDSSATLLIEETAGLTVVEAAPYATTTDGSISVTNETTGALTITVKPAVTDDLDVGTYRYDVQMLTTTGVVTTLTTGNFVVDVTTDVTRAIA
jgi:hypothetical protein